MKKKLLILSAFFLLCSCTQNSQIDYIGSWSGAVLFIEVTYVFTKDAYEMQILTFDNIQLGGKRGVITKRKNGVLFLNETHSYFFDSLSNSGSWLPTTDFYTYNYVIDGLTMKIESSCVENPVIESVVLKKQDDEKTNQSA